MSILTKEALKQFLKITTEDEDLRIENAAKAASKIMERLCDREFDSKPLTDEEYDGTDGRKLWLRRTPITTLTAVKYGYTTLVTIDASFYKYSSEGELYFINGSVFTKAATNDRYWKISYTGGYTPSNMPPELIRATAWIAALEYKEQDSQRFGITSKSLQSAVVESYSRELPKWVQDVINNYRRIFLCG